MASDTASGSEPSGRRGREDTRGPEPRPARRFPSVGDLFAMLGIVLGMQIVVTLVAMLVTVVLGIDLNGMEPSGQGRFMAFTYLGSMLPAYLLVLWYRRARGGRGSVGHFSSRGLDPVLLLWAFLMMIAAGIVCEPLLTLLPPPPMTQLGRGVWTLLSLVVMAPVLEELLCRGVVLGSLRTRYGVVTAWIFSSLFFGILHLQPVLVINAFVIGLVLGYVYLVTDSLWAPIILHALNNAVAYLFLIAGQGDAMFIDLVGSRTLYVVIYIAALTVTAVSAYMIRRSLRRLKREKKNRAQA